MTWLHWEVRWQGQCARCFLDPGDACWIPSYFDLAPICLRCAELEKGHPDYERAVQAEDRELALGNAAFRGIGLPYDLKVVTEASRPVHRPK